MTAIEIQRHIDYLKQRYAWLSDPVEKADVLDELIFYNQLLREAQ